MDFAEYAIPSAEWTDYEKTWTPPTPPAGATLQQIREGANAAGAALHAKILGIPENVIVVDVTVPSEDGHPLPGRVYRPKNVPADKILPLYIFFHGGGYFIGNLASDDVRCRLVAAKAEVSVLHVEYRHTPEWTFPSPVQDAWATFQWAHVHAAEHRWDPTKFVVGGISAGSTLAIDVVRRSLEPNTTTPPLKGAVLTVPATVYPSVFPMELVKDGRSSWETNAQAPFLNAASIRGLFDLYKPVEDHPDMSPLLLPASTWKGLGKTVVHVAGLDPLRDEGLLFEAKLREAGVETQLYIYPGLPHAFMNHPALPSSKLWRERTWKAIRDITEN